MMIFISNASHSEVINITGIVTSSPCVFDTSNSDTTVFFDKVYKGQLFEKESYGNEKKIKLIVTNCPAITNSVTVEFSGPVDNSNTHAYANQGTAKNVAVQLKFSDEQWDNSSTYPGGKFLIPVNKSTQSATFDMLARVYSKTGNATSGNILTTVNISFTYQ